LNGEKLGAGSEPEAATNLNALFQGNLENDMNAQIQGNLAAVAICSGAVSAACAAPSITTQRRINLSALEPR